MAHKGIALIAFGHPGSAKSPRAPMNPPPADTQAADDEETEDSVTLPKGYDPGVKPGETFEAVTKYKLSDDGKTAEVMAVDGMPVGSEQDEGEEDEGSPQSGSTGPNAPNDIDAMGQSYSQAVRSGSGM